MCKFLKKFSIFFIILFFSSVNFAMDEVQPVLKATTKFGDIYREITALGKGGYLLKECDFITDPKSDKAQIYCFSRLNTLQGLGRPTKIGDENYDILKTKYEDEQKKSKKNKQPKQKIKYSPINALIKR